MSLTKQPPHWSSGFNNTYGKPAGQAKNKRHKKIGARGEERGKRRDSPSAEVYDAGNTSNKLVLTNSDMGDTSKSTDSSHVRDSSNTSRSPYSPDPERHSPDPSSRKNQDRQAVSGFRRTAPRPRTSPASVGHSKGASFRTEHPAGMDRRRGGSPPPRPQTRQCFTPHPPRCGTPQHKRKTPISMSDNHYLMHKSMSRGSRAYLWSIAKVYDISNLKRLKQMQYQELLLKQLYSGFHTVEEYRRYARYLDTPRQQLFRPSSSSPQSGRRSAPPAQCSPAPSKAKATAHSTDETSSSSNSKEQKTGDKPSGTKPSGGAPRGKSQRTESQRTEPVRPTDRKASKTPPAAEQKNGKMPVKKSATGLKSSRSKSDQEAHEDADAKDPQGRKDRDSPMSRSPDERVVSDESTLKAEDERNANANDHSGRGGESRPDGKDSGSQAQDTARSYDMKLLRAVTSGEYDTNDDSGSEGQSLNEQERSGQVIHKQESDASDAAVPEDSSQERQRERHLVHSDSVAVAVHDNSDGGEGGPGGETVERPGPLQPAYEEQITTTTQPQPVPRDSDNKDEVEDDDFDEQSMPRSSLSAQQQEITIQEDDGDHHGLSDTEDERGDGTPTRAPEGTLRPKSRLGNRTLPTSEASESERRTTEDSCNGNLATTEDTENGNGGDSNDDGAKTEIVAPSGEYNDQHDPDATASGREGDDTLNLEGSSVKSGVDVTLYGSGEARASEAPVGGRNVSVDVPESCESSGNVEGNKCSSATEDVNGLVRVDAMNMHEGEMSSVSNGSQDANALKAIGENEDKYGQSSKQGDRGATDPAEPGPKASGTPSTRNTSWNDENTLTEDSAAENGDEGTTPVNRMPDRKRSEDLVFGPVDSFDDVPLEQDGGCIEEDGERIDNGGDQHPLDPLSGKKQKHKPSIASTDTQQEDRTMSQTTRHTRPDQIDAARDEESNHEDQDTHLETTSTQCHQQQHGQDEEHTRNRDEEENSQQQERGGKVSGSLEEQLKVLLSGLQVACEEEETDKGEDGATGGGPRPMEPGVDDHNGPGAMNKSSAPEHDQTDHGVHTEKDKEDSRDNIPSDTDQLTVQSTGGMSQEKHKISQASKSRDGSLKDDGQAFQEKGCMSEEADRHFEDGHTIDKDPEEDQEKMEDKQKEARMKAYEENFGRMRFRAVKVEFKTMERAEHEQNNNDIHIDKSTLDNNFEGDSIRSDIKGDQVSLSSPRTTSPAGNQPKDDRVSLGSSPRTTSPAGNQPKDDRVSLGSSPRTTSPAGNQPKDDRVFLGNSPRTTSPPGNQPKDDRVSLGSSPRTTSPAGNQPKDDRVSLGNSPRTANPDGNQPKDDRVSLGNSPRTSSPDGNQPKDDRVSLGNSPRTTSLSGNQPKDDRVSLGNSPRTASPAGNQPKDDRVSLGSSPRTTSPAGNQPKDDRVSLGSSPRPTSLSGNQPKDDRSSSPRVASPDSDQHKGDKLSSGCSLRAESPQNDNHPAQDITERSSVHTTRMATPDTDKGDVLSSRSSTVPSLSPGPSSSQLLDADSVPDKPAQTAVASQHADPTVELSTESHKNASRPGSRLQMDAKEPQPPGPPDQRVDSSDDDEHRLGRAGLFD